MEIRVMTFNIHHGVGMDGQLNLKRIADVITAAKPDIVGLNEVDRFHRRSDHIDEASYLGDLTGMYSIFGPSVVRKRKGSKRLPQKSTPADDSSIRLHSPTMSVSNDVHGPLPDTIYYGNALLSRYPILNTATHSFPFPAGIESRSAIEAKIDVQGKSVKIFVTHLSLDPITHLRQTHLLMHKVLPLHEPTLLMGDWNMLPGGPRYRRMTRYLMDAWDARRKGGETYPSGKPTRRLDYVFISPHFSVEKTKVVSENPYASDHLPLLATLRLT